jgi:predicted DsbA family dithiol-disulfide isomerase
VGSTNKEAAAMKMEIWSDYECPFSYIGKRKFEVALQKAWNEDHPLVEFVISDDEGVLCTEDGCMIPEKAENPYD